MLITFEGGDGAGKSTQLVHVRLWLEQQGFQVLQTREPGGSPLGQEIRALLLHTTTPVSPWAELLLFAADRAQHVSQVLKPALEQGQIVLCDRYTDSTLAYQGWGRGLDVVQIQRINDLATGGIVPDVTLWLDVPPAIGRSRTAQRALDRMEDTHTAFHERVYRGFEQLYKDHPGRIVHINGSLDQEIVFAEIKKQLISRLPPCPRGSTS